MLRQYRESLSSYYHGLCVRDKITRTARGNRRIAKISHVFHLFKKKSPICCIEGRLAVRQSYESAGIEAFLNFSSNIGSQMALLF